MVPYKSFAHVLKSVKIKTSELLYIYFFHNYAKWLSYLSGILSIGVFIGTINKILSLAILSLLFGCFVLPFIGFTLIVFYCWLVLCCFTAQYFIQKYFLHETIQNKTRATNVVDNFIHIDILLKLKNKECKIIHTEKYGYSIMIKDSREHICFVTESGIKKIKILLDN